jgi:hypothetical protein
MSDDSFSPVHKLLNDITCWSEALRARVDDSWNDEQRKLLDIIQTSTDNPARFLTPLPPDPKDLLVWKHDTLSPIIAITGAAELLVEDFELSPEFELKDYAQRIFDASIRARELVIAIADAALRKAPNG